MPAYLYRCPKGHEFEVRMTYDEFDMLRDNSRTRSQQLCNEIIDIYECCSYAVPCLESASIQIQSTPFKINLLEE